MLSGIIILCIAIILFATLKPGKYINMVTSSLGVLLVLIVCNFTDPISVWNILLGQDTFAPWKVLVIFFTVAYCAVSTDVTGLFEAISYKIIHIAKGNTKKLFFLFYLFACILTVFTSNDIVILTLTPIIFYLGKYSNISILPFLIAEFFAANTMSMLFLIGNPTNIIITQSLGIGFFEYFQVMFFPTVIAAISNYTLLHFIFRRELAGNYTLKNEKNPEIRSPLDVKISIVLIVLMIGSLIFSDMLNIELWQVTTLFFFLFFIEDLLFFFLRRRKKHLPVLFYEIAGKAESQSDVYTAFQRMPFAIAPFVITFFVLISLFQQTNLYQELIMFSGRYSGNILVDIWGYGFASFFMANIINNQPMSILFSQIFLDLSVSSVGMYYAAIISSNLGANFSLFGALAGLMWIKILKDKGYTISFLSFLKYGLSITLITLNITFLTLYFVIR